MTNCKNCNNEFSEPYCPKCGLPATLRRIDKHYISHEFLHLFHFEQGFLYTAKELMLRPGDSIREFIFDNRNKLVKPVAYIILTSLLFTLVAHYFHVDDLYNSKEKLEMGSSSVTTIMTWVQANYGYANIISGFFYAFMVHLFFRKYKYNFFEIVVLLCFVMGQGMLILTFETLFINLIGFNYYSIILIIIAFGYPTFAIGQFFDKSKFLSYVKAFLAYFLGYILFYLAITVIGTLYDNLVGRI